MFEIDKIVLFNLKTINNIDDLIIQKKVVLA
jgi:hypothetical protein